MNFCTPAPQFDREFLESYARMRDDVMRNAKMSDADLAFYDQHFVASYTKNATTGYHALSYTLDGPNSGKELHYQ